MRNLSKSITNSKIHITNAWHALFTSSVSKHFCSFWFFLFFCGQSFFYMSTLIIWWMRAIFSIYRHLLPVRTGQQKETN